GPRAGASAAVLVSLGGSENVKGLLSVIDGSESRGRSTAPATELVSGAAVESPGIDSEAAATAAGSSGSSALRWAAMKITAIAQATNTKNPQPRCFGIS